MSDDGVLDSWPIVPGYYLGNGVTTVQATADHKPSVIWLHDSHRGLVGKSLSFIFVIHI
jgi:hypothetical protein